MNSKMNFSAVAGAICVASRAALRRKARKTFRLEAVPRDVLADILRMAGGVSGIRLVSRGLRAATLPPVPVETSTVEDFFLCLAAMADNLALACLEWAACVGLKSQHPTTLDIATKVGDIRVLEWLGVPKDKDMHGLYFCAKAAARHGSTHVLHWMLETGVDMRYPTQGAFEAAADGGHVDTMAWVIENCPRVRCFGQAALSAAKNGHLPALEYLRSQGYEFQNSSALQHAVIGGKLDAVKWLRQLGCQWNPVMFQCAVRTLDLDALKWMMADGCPVGHDTFASVKGWNIEVMEWLLAEGFPVCARDCAVVAYEGRLDVLEWMRSNGFPLDESVMLRALRAGPETVQWLFDNGCPASGSVFAEAAGLCDTGVLETLKANGCPLDRRAYDNAVRCNNTAAIAWLGDNGYP